MKSGIHPPYVETTVVCGCGNTFQTRSTKESGRIVVEVCSQCHPAYTGKARTEVSGSRVERFERLHPSAKVHVEYLHPDRVYERVHEGVADLGLVSFPRRLRELVVEPWREEEMVLACAPGHPDSTTRGRTSGIGFSVTCNWE